jgi:WD40 repeat protein
LAPDFYFGTLFYSPDGTRIAYGQSDGTIRIWETANGKLVSTLHGHSGYVNRISFSADGKRLASASDDKTAKVWDLASGKELATFTGHTTGVMAVAFRPDGKRVASGGRYPDQAVRIWDADNGNELNEFKMPPAPIFDLKFSPDGKHLAVGTATNNSFYTGGSVHVLDAATGAPLFSPVNNEATYEIDYSPDGKHLAITDSGIVAKVFDALTGKEVLTLRGLNSTPISIAYANDGKRLATVNADSSVTVWDAGSGEIIFTIYDKSLSSSQSIAFSPDGTRVATGDLNGIRIYFTQTQDLVAIAKTRVTRALTQEECSKYLHVAQCPQNQ